MIETERLWIRPFDGGDLDVVAELYGDGEIVKYTPFPVLTRAQAKEQLQRFMDGWQRDPQVNYEMAGVRKDTNETIGRAEITRYHDEESAMVGWMLVKSEWGKGYATEIIRLGLEECRKLGITRVLMVCDKSNVGSRKSIERNGGILENEIEVDGEVEQRYWIDLA